MFSDDSDDEYMLKKCLDVKLSSNFDPHKIPESGKTYMYYYSDLPSNFW